MLTAGEIGADIGTGFVFSFGAQIAASLLLVALVQAGCQWFDGRRRPAPSRPVPPGAG